MDTTTTEIAPTYQELGFYLPFDVIDDEQAHTLRADLEAAETELAQQPKKLKLLRQYPHLLLPAFDALIQRPNLVDAVSEILGPDLLVWGCSLFIKEARSTSIVSWHQDLTYWGLDDIDEVTAWVALSPSTPESGGMRFVPGSHKFDIVDHVDTFAENNLLSRGQEIAVSVDDTSATNVLLQPGQASLHHGRLFHSSGPNVSNDRRIGVAIRYITPSMQQTGGQKPIARQICGEDRFWHFTLVPGPGERLAASDFERCRADLALREQILFTGIKS